MHQREEAASRFSKCAARMTVRHHNRIREFERRGVERQQQLSPSSSFSSSCRYFSALVTMKLARLVPSKLIVLFVRVISPRFARNLLPLVVSYTPVRTQLATLSPAPPPARPSRFSSEPPGFLIPQMLQVSRRAQLRFMHMVQCQSPSLGAGIFPLGSSGLTCFIPRPLEGMGPAEAGRCVWSE